MKDETQIVLLLVEPGAGRTKQTLGRSSEQKRSVPAAAAPSKPSPFASVSGSPVHWCSRRFLFLEKVIASLALQDLDCSHEVGDLHQRNWMAIEARVGSDLRPAGSGKPFAFLALGSLS